MEGSIKQWLPTICTSSFNDYPKGTIFKRGLVILGAQFETPEKVSFSKGGSALSENQAPLKCLIEHPESVVISGSCPKLTPYLNDERQFWVLVPATACLLL